MKLFSYAQATKPADAVQLLGAQTQSKFIAGGTNLVDLMKYDVESPDRLVDISQLALTQIDATDKGLRIGALARNSDVAANALVMKQFPLLSEALLAGASPQLRNMATMGGNLLQRTRCHYFYDVSQPCNKRAAGSGCGAIGGYNRIHAILGSSPSCIATNPSDMNVALAALDAVVQVTGPNGSRSIPILDFHRLPGNTPQRDTVLEANELITAVDLPTTAIGGKSHYLKVRDRASYAFALVSVAARLAVENGVVRDVRIALGGVAHKPWRLPDVEKNMVGKPATETTFRSAAKALLAGAQPHEHNAFKIQLAENAIVRALQTVS
ncbi:xanthine dehydrogenase family protein subunit M [Fibrella sp. HMF5335]|uniref:Xanthine dehydrogenase family protein subunit M n=1 Tax=Fibrella rubiginis TaxID=2817060 RepID=A0A939K7A4_9BACT|nr:xanthine dehydrogenase family protein subunit M [Fibrella rubiginis]MBO0938410.1 xanthine dehydrogenase family protein subunit M [Fibrella rubiginis]